MCIRDRINTLKEGDQRFKNEMVEVTDEQGNVSMQKENTYILKLINLYIYRSQFDDAIKALDVVIAENPTNADYWNVKGSLYEAQKNMDQAVECFLKAIEISPNMPEALGNLGRIYSVSYTHLDVYKRQEFPPSDKNRLIRDL